MHIQAVAQIFSAAFCLRSHDLVYFLIQRHSWQNGRAFIYSSRLEVLIIAVGFFVSMLVCPIASKAIIGKDLNTTRLTWITVIILGYLAVMQGSAIAYLRISRLTRVIVFGDFLSFIAGLVSIIWLVSKQNISSFHVLVVGLTIVCVKSIYLNAWSALNELRCRGMHKNCGKPLDVKVVASFLFSGQLTNIVKNSLLSFETLLLGGLGQSGSVAVFRVSKSFFGITNMMLNTQYQRSYKSLAVSESPSATLTAIKSAAKRSMLIWGVSLVPVTFIVAIYLRLNSHPDYENLPMVVVLMALSSLPIALQQGEFGYLTQRGQFGIINRVYVLSALLFAGICWFNQIFKSFNLFMVTMIVSYVFRYYLLRREVRKMLVGSWKNNSF